MAMTTIPFLGFTEPVSSWSHLLSAGASLWGLFFFIAKGKGNGPRLFSLVVFSITLIFLFSMSGVFHLLDIGGPARAVLQRLDHAGIWAMIAGTFTPIHTILFRGVWRWGILLLIWTIAITGLVLEVIFFQSFPEWLTLSFFLGMGWIGLFSMLKFMKSFADPSIKFLIAGGLSYTVGAIFDFLRWPVIWPGVIQHHEVFHAFVILGAYFHWRFIYAWANHPIGNQIIFEVNVYPSGECFAQALNEHIYLRAPTKDAMKEMVQNQVREKYHHHILPTIRIRYFREEHIQL